MSRAGLVTVMILIAVLAVAPVAGAEGKPMTRVASDLMALHAEYIARGTGPAFQSQNRLARVIEARVVIDAVADGDVKALEADLRGLGMQGVSVFGRTVSGEMPLASIPALDGLVRLRSARPAYAARRVGLVTSQGDQAMRADVARATFGVSGAGVTVGVLSDSFNCLNGANANVASGDLSPVNVIQEISNCSDGKDEGRAMLQIVHDVAPGAGLAFASAFNGTASFANNILALQQAGAKVIVDDVGLLTQPFFQDGDIAQAVNTVAAQGSAYFSAAGNDARQSYQAAFQPGSVFAKDQFPSAAGAPRFFGGVAHNFNSGATPYFQRITIPANQTLFVVLQWDSPFFSVSGPPGSPNDVDVYLLNAAGNRVVDGSNFINTGDDPVEAFAFTNSGATADFNLMILSFDGPPPGLVKYINFGDSNVVINDPNAASSTLFGHPNAAGAVAVGAAFYLQTPVFGVNPPLLEPFSSAGGTPILFDTTGARLGVPLTRQKPEVVAPDGVDTTFFGQVIPQDHNNFPNFFGTSAAAPHAAAVAALLLQKQPSLTPAAISYVLQRTAIDMKQPGFDFDSGFGLVQADAAVGALPLQPLASAVLPSSRSVQVGTAATAFAAVINAGSSTASQVSLSLGTALPGPPSFLYQTTNSANQPIGTPNTPVDIPPGGVQTFVFAITPPAAIAPTDVPFNFIGSNTMPATTISGVNTLLFSASPNPVPDIVALAATPDGDLIVKIPGTSGTGFFSVAAVNVGVGGSITVTADTGGATLPLTLTLCQTDAASACLNPPQGSVTTTINAAQTPTFAVFAQGHGQVPFDPGNNRIFVRFKDATQVTRGSTSTAVRTQ